MQEPWHRGVSPEERVKGIEPSSTAWEAAALPLCYTREVDSRTIHVADWHEQAIGEDVGWPRYAGSLGTRLVAAPRPAVVLRATTYVLGSCN